MAVTIVPTTAGEEPGEALVIDFEDGQRLQQQLRMANAPTSTPPGNPAGQSTQQLGAPGQLPSLNQPVQAQFGQPQMQNGFQQVQQPAGAQQPNLNLNNLPPLPSFPNENGNQIATPPGGNVLR